MKSTFILLLLLASVDLHSKSKHPHHRRERFLDFLFKRSKLVKSDCSRPLDMKFIKAEPPEAPISHIEEGLFLTFHIGSVSRDKVLVRSELNLFQTTVRSVYECAPAGNYKITILEKVSSWFHPEKVRSLAFKVVTPNYNGWRNFNITKATKQWLHQDQTQLNITVIVIVQNPSGDYLIPDLFGIYGVECESDEYIPFISIFSM